MENEDNCFETNLLAYNASVDQRVTLKKKHYSKYLKTAIELRTEFRLKIIA